MTRRVAHACPTPHLGAPFGSKSTPVPSDVLGCPMPSMTVVHRVMECQQLRVWGGVVSCSEELEGSTRPLGKALAAHALTRRQPYAPPQTRATQPYLR